MQRVLTKRWAALTSRKTVHWNTPRQLFDSLNREFGFQVDVCGTLDRTLCPVTFTLDRNGLGQKWAPKACWCNPPYGPDLGHWMRKAFEESRRGATVVCLVPARTDTAWWHDYAMRGEVRFIRGRLQFSESNHAAPFPSVVIVFRPPAKDGKMRLGEKPKGESPLLAFRISDETKQTLKEVAKLEDITPSEYARRALENALRKDSAARSREAAKAR